MPRRHERKPRCLDTQSVAAAAQVVLAATRPPVKSGPVSFCWGFARSDLHLLVRYRLVARGSRVLTRVFTVCGVLLVPWTGVLVEQLHGHAGERSFAASWVGLDVLEAVCLLSVAQLMRRQHRATSPAAAATAAILCIDAWFDTMSAAPQLPYAEALAMACFAELPLAALLAWTAWHSLKWAALREDAVTAPAVGQATSETAR